MIKLKKLLKEEFMDFALSQILPTIKTAFNKKYPGVELYGEESDYCYISTYPEPEQSTMWGKIPEDGKDDYYLALHLYVDEEDGEDVINLIIANATANKYKNVTADILKALFDLAKSKNPKATRSVLVIDQDASGGTWEKIAAKLGVEYEEN